MIHCRVPIGWMVTSASRDVPFSISTCLPASITSPPHLTSPHTSLFEPSPLTVAYAGAEAAVGTHTHSTTRRIGIRFGPPTTPLSSIGIRYTHGTTSRNNNKEQQHDTQQRMQYAVSESSMQHHLFHRTLASPRCSPFLSFPHLLHFL